MPSPNEHPEAHPEPTPVEPGSSASTADPATATRKEEARVSLARDGVAPALLVVLLIVGGLELSTLYRFNAAVVRLNQALEANEVDLLPKAEVERILGKQADAPLRREPMGQVTTYTWRGALRSHVLTASFSPGKEPGLIHYEVGPAEAAD